MKKICLFLFITCILSVNSMDARSAVEIPNIAVETSINADQYDLEVLVKALEELGFEVEKLEVQDPEKKKEKECKVTIKGTIKGDDVDITVTVKGQTCGEILKEILSK